MEQSVFERRRKEFMEKLGSGMAVLFAAPHAKRNHDVHYEYRTCSTFYYLTGFREQEAAAIFFPQDSKPYRLFVLPKDPVKEMWEGVRVGVEGAKAEYKSDEAHPIGDLETVLKGLLKKTDTLFYSLGSFPEQDDIIHRLLKEHHPNPRIGDKNFQALRTVQDLVAPMRKVKSAQEIQVMRVNCQNSSLAHRKAMEFTAPGKYEYQVEAEIEYWFRNLGADDLAYSSIVAGGNNANVLHYKTNRDLLKDGDLLLIDAGGECNGYASDITRTFPVSGKFTPAQKKIYEIVLDAQKEAIQMVRPGVKFHDIHDFTVRILVEGLLRIGLLKGNLEEIVKDKSKYGSFYPHNTSHWLGLDVHDIGDYFEQGKSIPLETGNVLTIEPGIYISSSRTDVPEEYRGIGIRIEDDILVTANGYENLTVNCPKELAEIESIVGTNSKR